MLMLMKPSAKPRLSSTELRALCKPYKINRTKHPLLIVGIRGYYRNTLGVTGANDRGIYDDALFIDSPNCTVSFNANTDPSRYRKGKGTHQGSKGMAMLESGLWTCYRFGKHKTYPALIQTGGMVTVIRDGTPNYPDTGYFGINIHRGGINTTSSEGCQTIHPDQWKSFIELATAEAKRLFGAQYTQVTIPYLLLENNGQI